MRLNQEKAKQQQLQKQQEDEAAEKALNEAAIRKV
jgi:hypothetical protein